MNVVQTAQSLAIAAAKSKLDDKVYSSINFYMETPNFELTLDEFEVYALKRLKVLKKIEQLRNFKVSIDQTKHKLDQLIKEENLNDGLIDEASHFILRLSYCKTEDLRNWFCRHESELFRHRIQSLPDHKLAQSVKKYALVQPISASEKEALRDDLLQIMSPAEYTKQKLFAVPFTQALNLVSSRSCLVRRGKVYVPESKVMDILVNKFRMNLSRDLALMGKLQQTSAISRKDPEAVRIYPLVNNLDRVLVNREPESDNMGALGSDQTLTASTVDSFVSNMPLCMRGLHKGMQRDKKLKHGGRLQYSLFLKGAGLSLDDSLAFFQRNFSAVTAEKFQKEYAYSLRHIYGKEGKNWSKKAYWCTKIIMGDAPSAGQYHGCPYKHYDENHLNQLLQQCNIRDVLDRKAILQLKQAHQYQLACQKQFDVQHKGAMSKGVNTDNVGNHPNAWFRASVQYDCKVNNMDDVVMTESVVKTEDDSIQPMNVVS